MRRATETSKVTEVVPGSSGGGDVGRTIGRLSNNRQVREPSRRSSPGGSGRSRRWDDKAGESAMRATYVPLLWVLALTGFAIDQASKYAVFASLDGAAGHRRVLIPRSVELFAVLAGHDSDESATRPNSGASRRPADQWGRGFEVGRAAVNVATCLIIVTWGAHRTAAGDKKLCIALGLMLAGVLGNLYDRVLLGGVRDFLHCYSAVGGLVFNIADCCLVAGGARLLLHALRAPPPNTVTPNARVCVSGAAPP
jgi:signal peptidase II